MAKRVGFYGTNFRGNAELVQVKRGQTGHVRGTLGRIMAILSLFVVMSFGLVACGTNNISGLANPTLSSNASNSTVTTTIATTGASSSTTGSTGNSNTSFNISTTATTSANVPTTSSSSTNGNNPGANGISSSGGTVTVSSQNGQAQSGNLLSPTGNLEQDVPNVVARVRQAVVMITVQTSQGTAAGTGSLVTSDGYILTNYHVVDGATSITVVTFSGQRLTAKLVEPVPYNDLAVIKVEGSNFPTIPMGTTTNLQVGQWVVAIGNALALKGNPTVTTGIVSALGRSIQEPAPTYANLTGLVQTSAAINPGNSGGPLVNLQGQIVGIDTAAPVDPQSGAAAQGIGFAIPIDQAKSILQAAINGTPLKRPYLGIQPQDMTPGLAARYNLPSDTGVLVVSVQSSSPAATAGWKTGDIITQLNGTQINGLSDLEGVLSNHKPGDTVTFSIITPQGQTQTGNITFAQYPNPQG